MLAASRKEYEQLGTEIKSIKDCITTYIGYIIGSNGIAFLLFSALKICNICESSYANSGDIIIITEILMMLAIYYIMNYKFLNNDIH